MSCSSSSGSEGEEEGFDAYRKGGYHAVRIGDCFAGGRYIAQRKLGWGQFSTVWLAYDTRSSEYEMSILRMFWFIYVSMALSILLQRQLKPIHSNLISAPEGESSFVLCDWGIFIIGGSKKGKPTSDVSVFNCVHHIWDRAPSMKIARCGVSASLIDAKIFVFGGCSEDTDSSNWAEVFNLRTQTWDFLFVSTPNKIPVNIRQSVVIDKEVYAVDEDGQNLSFSPSKSIFVGHGKTDSKEDGNITDWCLFGEFLFCGSKGGKIMWCLPYELVWKEVKSLEELKSLCGDNEIINICINSSKRIAIFSIARPDDHPDILEL